MLSEVYSHGIIDPHFFENAKDRTITVNADRSKFVPETFLRNELHYLQLWFQQDGATAYRAHISMQVLRIMLPGTLSSHFGSITCPTRSPDLSSYVATLQARYTKHVIPILLTSNSKFCSIFKGSLRECYIVLKTAFPSRLQPCTEQRGGHLQSIVFKQLWLIWVLVDMECIR